MGCVRQQKDAKKEFKMHLLIAGLCGISILIKLIDSIKKIKERTEVRRFDYFVVITGIPLLLWALIYFVYRYVLA